jgi:preprotein translocase subunit SecG
LIVAVHVLVSILLIVLVLLHSGKGGGLSDMFGGVGAAAAGSTVMERNLDRLTVVFSVIWAFTTLILAIRLQ